MKCKNCSHEEEHHAPKELGGCAMIYKHYKNKEDRKDNPINYKLKSCLCKEITTQSEDSGNLGGKNG